MTRKKGGGRGGRGGHGKFRQKRSKEEWEAMKRENPDLAKQADYKLAPKQNAEFETYYQGIGIVPEEEWDTFMTSLRKPLPTTFRITGSRNQAQELLKIIKGQYFSKFMSRGDGHPTLEPKSLPWYPDELAWQIDFTKKEIKNDQNLKRLHRFLMSETESGNISRQEAVSMIPPLLLEIEPHHKILDMCAAPGSKTAQLIEMLHNDENILVPEGFVVANDRDNKRCYLMTHQVKRIQSPNCMIINHDARVLPNMATSDDENPQFVKYDRVLCDVPCSGDGTIRKNPDIWKRWNVNGALNLHGVQKKVLQRGLELLAVGGRLVYSTCSLNPVEDEAVILTLIKQCEGAIELVDVSDKLTGLKYSKGTYSWKVRSRDGTWYETKEQAPEHFNNKWETSIYPPIILEAQDAKLERCIRVLPHQQNTGAFFIAVLQKTKELPWNTKVEKTAEQVIKQRIDPEEAKKLQSEYEHFTFNFTCNRGRTSYAKCNLCNTMCSARNDFTNHLSGRRHKASLEKLELETEKKIKTEADEDGDVKMETKQESVDNENKEGNGTVTSGTTDDGNTELNGNHVNVKTEPGTSVSIKEEVDTASDEPPAKRSRPNNDGEIQVRFTGHREDPFYFCAKNDPIWPSIKNFYGIADTFNIQQVMYRNMKRILYYVSEPVRNLVINNTDRVKFINLGVKCFSNAPSPLVPDCDFRLSQDGLLAIQGHIEGRRVLLQKQDVITILSNENPFICKLTSKCQGDVYALDPGSCLFHFKPSESDPEPNVEIVFCGWRGKTSVRSFVSKDERSHYLRICGVELSDIQSEVQKKKEARDDDEPGPSGTETPMLVPSGDEAELEQWNKVTDVPRGLEVDDTEDSRLSFPPVPVDNDDKNNDDDDNSDGGGNNGAEAADG
ncbi:tRNA (cytosine(34)-C(5))-methyltransferase [Mactra antiquata]